MQVMVTGGTYAKEYCPRTGDMGFSDIESVNDLLSNVFLKEPVGVHSWDQLLDSKAITDDDRRSLYRQCWEAMYPGDNKLLVIHGTDTMEYTARYFAEQSSFKDRTCVFTGSWLPLSCKDTDAEFSLGFAVACLKLKPPGVYLAMNGECFDAMNVCKNWNTMQFEEKFAAPKSGANLSDVDIV